MTNSFCAFAQLTGANKFKMQEYIRKTDLKNFALAKRNIIVSFPVQNNQSDINNAAKIFNLGVDIFIYDPVNLSSKTAVELGFKLRQLCSLFDILFFVKDRCDYAKILDSEGIFLDNESYDIIYAKKILPDSVMFGCKADSKETDVEAFDFIISKQNLNIIKPCFLDVLNSQKTLSTKVFINSPDVNIIRKYKAKGTM